MAGRARLYGAFAVAVAAIACYWELQDPRDHYAALGVSRSATTKEIRAGYKAKALLYHPDKVMSRRFAPWYVRLWRLATGEKSLGSPPDPLASQYSPYAPFVSPPPLSFI